MAGTYKREKREQLLFSDRGATLKMGGGGGGEVASDSKSGAENTFFSVTLYYFQNKWGWGGGERLKFYVMQFTFCHWI